MVRVKFNKIDIVVPLVADPSTSPPPPLPLLGTTDKYNTTETKGL